MQGESVAPKLGDISRRDKEGLAGRSKIIWNACPDCGAEKWSLYSLYRAKDGKVLCQSCTGKAAIQRGIVKTAPHKEGCKCNRCLFTNKEMFGPRHPSWKGGKKKNGQGYISVWIAPDHRFAAMRDSNGHVLEHRLVVAESIERPLQKHEYVHHINGDKSDNRLNNLELWARPHPSGARFKDYHCPGCRCFEHEEASHD